MDLISGLKVTGENGCYVKNLFSDCVWVVMSMSMSMKGVRDGNRDDDDDDDEDGDGFRQDR